MIRDVMDKKVTLKHVISIVSKNKENLKLRT